MRTTLTIDDDVLSAAKERARAEHRTMGEVISEMARSGFARSVSSPEAKARDERLAELGIRVLPSRGGIVTQELVNEIRDELGI
ncbi:MAG: hypothetical protein LBK95_21305 [Bifidobacteriaceae bacterium]|jgi:hypothetical protein|nr:hypothetical protein [Bifidobacteriaceae bacterium]